MEIATAAIVTVPIVTTLQFQNSSQNSMAQDYHQGVFSFSNGFERPQPQEQPQIRRDKLRVPGFDAVGIEEESSAGLHVYESAGMLSEMFNFPPATELLENQILQSYRNSRAAAADWFSHRQGMVVGGGGADLPDSKNNQDQQQQISGINGDSAAAMQLFLTNPQHQHQTSPSPSPSPHPPAAAAAASTSSTLHMLLPNPPSSGGGFGQFPWVNVPGENPGVVEGQGLSLSLSSSLQHLNAAKAEDFRIGEGGMLYFGGNNNSGALNFQGGVGHHNHHQLAPAPGIASPYGTAAVSMVRNSKYAKPAQELLEEFCCVGRGQLRKTKFSKQNNNAGNPNSSTTAGTTTTSGGASAKDTPPPLSAADRLEHQRRKVKLLSMLDEVDRRYSHYCEQMQMVVNSFDMLMGYGSAVPYTSLAQKAMSRHFRCLKDSVTTQLKHTCDLLGEKDAAGAFSSGVTKGETPRLRILDQSLRQQRAFHQMGMMEQEAWRPQRGLPERSVNILRAWLFEHFLHPYPSDADKHLLARQTGLSRNQVSNWFINARVRLWKPMVEDMYQQEAKEESSSATAAAGDDDQTTTTTAQTPSSIAAPTAGAPAPDIINAPGNYTASAAAMEQEETVMESTPMIGFGASAGDVSLTLGLRHAGNLPDKGSFTVRDFGGF